MSKFMSYEEFKLFEGGSVKAEGGFDIDNFFDLVYYMMPEWKIEHPKTRKSSYGGKTEVYDDSNVILARKEDEKLIFYRHYYHEEKAGKRAWVKEFYVLGEPSDVKEFLPEEIVIPMKNRNDHYSVKLTEVHDSIFPDSGDWTFEMSMHTVSQKYSDFAGFQRKSIYEIILTKTKSEKVAIVSPDEIKKYAGYQEFLKAGFVETASEKSMRSLNFSFGFPDVLIAGGEDLHYILDEKNRIFYKVFIVTASGYLRQHKNGAKESPVIAFLDKNRKKAGGPYGRPGLAFKTEDEWNEAFKLLLEKSMAIIKKECKRYKAEPIFYPGPEKRGILSGYDLGIL